MVDFFFFAVPPWPHALFFVVLFLSFQILNLLLVRQPLNHNLLLDEVCDAFGIDIFFGVEEFSYLVCFLFQTLLLSKVFQPCCPLIDLDMIQESIPTRDVNCFDRGT